MTSIETYAAAAARMAAAAILTADRARTLMADDSARIERADRIAVSLADCGRYDEVAYAFLSDEATAAVYERCATLLSLDLAWRS